MNGAPGSSSFFSFGKNDSFLSKSFAGLKYRNLPSDLRELLTSRNVSEVLWAALSPYKNSWVVSYKDGSNKTALRWGDDIPERLRTVLAKTWHSPHLRFFLGPVDSFIVWHPDLIRWANLPPSLEDTLQSWLTPSGWRVGPPRMVTWGPEGAFFAMSEYGDVVYKFGDNNVWDIYKETVEEWKAEKGFIWSELAFITLDPYMSDQFVAIRNDGTWAGSIDDVSEDALETFALNFFARAKGKHKSNPSTFSSKSKSGSNKRESIARTPDAATQALYETWSKDTATMFASASLASNGSKAKAPRKLQVRSPSNPQIPSDIPSMPSSTSDKLITSFPYLPSTITTCVLTACMILKSEPDSIKACQHDVERLMRASGLYSYEWLRQERLRWHPDRFGRLCEEAWKETGKKMAGEMFKVMSALIDEIASQEGRAKGSSAV